MKLKRITLPKSMFLGKTNLGEQLDAGAKAGLVLEYKPSERLVYVTYNKETALVPVEGCYLIPYNQSIAEELAKPAPRKQLVKAQVETPQGDLMTPGQGRTGQETK